MKRWFRVFALLVGASFAQQLQQNFPVGTIPFAGVPSGSCGPAQNAVNTATGVYYYCNGGVWTAIANNTFPTAASATESVNVVTLTTVSGNWPAAYQSGASVSVTGCSVAGYNITAAITGGGGGGTTLTYNDPTGSLGAASGCTANLASSSGGTITGVTAGTGLTGGGTSGNVTVNLTLPVASATSAAQVNGAAPPVSKTIVGTNGSGQLVDATGATLSNNTTGNANTATNATQLGATPTLCSAGQVPNGILANGNAANCAGITGTVTPTTQGEFVSCTGTGCLTTDRGRDVSAFCAAGFNNAAGKCNTGGDICQAIRDAQAAEILVAGPGILDARAFTGNQVCLQSNSNPTTMLYGVNALGNAGAVPETGVLLLPNATIAIDGPAAGYFSDGNTLVASGACGTGTCNPSTYGTPAIIIPFQYFGIVGVSKTDSVIAPCTGPGVPFGPCTTGWPSRIFPITSTSVAGNTMTITTSGTFTSAAAGTGCNQTGTCNIWVGEQSFIYQSTTANNNLKREILSVPTIHTATIAVPSTTSSCASACGNLRLYTPLIGFGSADWPYLPVVAHAAIQSFGMHVMNMQINGEHLPDLVGIQNVNAGEHSMVDGLFCVYCAGTAVSVERGSTESGPYIRIRTNDLTDPTGNNPATMGVYYATGGGQGVHGYSITNGTYQIHVSSFTGTSGTLTFTNTKSNGFFAGQANVVLSGFTGGNTGLNGQTVTILGAGLSNTQFEAAVTGSGYSSGTGTAAGPPTTACVDIEGDATGSGYSNMQLNDGHTEHCADGVQIGANRNTYGISITSLLGPPSVSGYAGNNVIHILNDGFTSAGLTIRGVVQQVGGTTNSILDDQNTIACTDRSPSFYELDNSGKAKHGCVTGSNLGAVGGNTQTTGSQISTPFFTNGTTYNSGSISASVGAVNVATAAMLPTGQYAVSCDVVVTAVGASPTLATTLGWTDISGTARTKTCTTGVVTVGDNPSVTTITSNGSAPLTITQTLAVSTATWQTTVGVTRLQ
jgi:hypothetical protein